MMARWQDILGSMSGDFDILLLLLVSLVLSAAIGFDRETRGRPAGLRTHVLVGLGTTLSVSLGQLLVLETTVEGSLVNHDPARILEAVITGVAFLGAGTIFFSRGQGRETVSGLTTAASMWLTAGIGIAVALNHFVLAVGSTILGVFVLRFMHFESVTGDEATDESSGCGEQ